ncbi:hypothetical protein PbJCM13498_34690 [Prolixibacter bellariivorans]|uniref:Secretion system C-terminal sorting domain-containing protein n=1 Tax=Prolixibacter bellariivorans TaxID=314319 RepID=A0A5M4B402_9BACT|nr:hypothetical protein PbJCM13498_34690 [Prolixibacter bellariivorans]
MGSWEEESASHPRVLFDGKIYRMWYMGMDYDYKRGLGLAMSKDGVHWTKYEGNPVLGPGEEGEWDDYGPEVPAIIYDKKECLFKMWYMGANEPYASIGSGYAWSKDGIHWTKYEHNPVLKIGEEGEWDQYYAALETVVYDGRIYRGWYTGFQDDSWYAHIGYCWSKDGIHWHKYKENPVLAPVPGTWNEAGIWVSSVVHKDGLYYMFYDGGDYAGSNSIAYATSKDGKNWEPYEDNPIFFASDSGFDDFWVLTPWVKYMRHEWKMWYTAINQDWVQSMGYASSREHPYIHQRQIARVNHHCIESIEPNPCSDYATIRIKMEQPGMVSMNILRTDGSLVQQLVNRKYEAGTHEIHFNASALHNGVYLCNLKLNDYKETKMMVKN